MSDFHVNDVVITTVSKKRVPEGSVGIVCGHHSRPGELLEVEFQTGEKIKIEMYRPDELKNY